ncbi:hypothetical protein H0H92_008136 [Tricholoma furcatifolium]|nr:hypothetical protein H0H92_008136 [Tricholoma furcatifolium]
MTYLVIIECASAAVRTHVFQWEDLSTLRTVTLEKAELYLVAKPGLRSTDSVQTVATRLAPILKELQHLLEAQTPPIEPGTVPVYLLSDEEREGVLESGLSVVKSFDYFKTGDTVDHIIAKDASDLQGFKWVALHFDKNLSVEVPFEVFADRGDKPVNLVYHDESNQLNLVLEYKDWYDSLPTLTSTANLFLGVAALIIKNGMSTVWESRNIMPFPPLELALEGSLKMTSWTSTTTLSWGTPLFHHISHVRQEEGLYERRRPTSKAAKWMATPAFDPVITTQVPPDLVETDEEGLGTVLETIIDLGFRRLPLHSLASTSPQESKEEVSHVYGASSNLLETTVTEAVADDHSQEDVTNILLRSLSLAASIPIPVDQQNGERAIEPRSLQIIADSLVLDEERAVPGPVIQAGSEIAQEAQGDSLPSLASASPGELKEEVPPKDNVHNTLPETKEIEAAEVANAVPEPIPEGASILNAVPEQHSGAPVVDSGSPIAVAHEGNSDENEAIQTTQPATIDVKTVSRPVPELTDLPFSALSSSALRFSEVFARVADEQKYAFVDELALGLLGYPRDAHSLKAVMDLPAEQTTALLEKIAAEDPAFVLDASPIQNNKVTYNSQLKRSADNFEEIQAHGGFDNDMGHLLHVLESGNTPALSFSGFHSGTDLSDSVMTLGQYLLAPSHDEGTGGLVLWKKILSALDDMHLAELEDMEISRLIQLSA